MPTPNESDPHLKLTWHFGDGTTVGPQEVVGKEGTYIAVVEHAFNSTCGGTCSVTLEAKDKEGAEGHAELKLAMYTPPPTTTPPTTTTPTTTTPTSTTPTETTPKGGVAGYIASFTGYSLPVSSSGATSVTITCPSGGSCSGTLTLQTAGAVAISEQEARQEGDPDARVQRLLARPAGGKSVTLHLSSTARALLSRSHGVLRAKLTILSRGIDGQQNSVTTHVVTLRLVPKKPQQALSSGRGRDMR